MLDIRVDGTRLTVVRIVLMGLMRKAETKLADPRKIYKKETFQCVVPVEGGISVQFQTLVEDITTGGIRFFLSEVKGYKKVIANLPITVYYKRTNGTYKFNSNIKFATVVPGVEGKMLQIGLPQKISKVK